MAFLQSVMRKRGQNMSDIKAQQIEVLQMVPEYVGKLAPAFKEIAGELKTEKKDDTIQFLNQAIEGLNFVIEIFNATYDLLNAKEELFQKDVVESKIQAMDQAVGANDDAAMAAAIEDGIVPFLEIFARIVTIFLEKGNA